ncbi:multicopper oxidase family protein, partial [Glycomyces tenuis]
MTEGISRRRMLGIGAGLGAVTVGGLALSAGWARRPAATGAELRSEVPLPEAFSVPLPIPPVLAPVESTAEGDRYEIAQREVEAEILPGFSTRLWTYEGSFPGPTIESRRGVQTTVLHRNELPVPTVVHLHGGRTPAASDGYPTDLVLPGEWSEHSGHVGHGMADDRAVVTNVQREYGFPLDQRATMLWYHDHRMDFTAPAVWRGLAGMHFVRDDVEDALGLPGGDHEVPLMIADRAFDADGQLAYPSLDPTLTGEPGVEKPYLAGVLGDVVLVNGAPWPAHEVDTGLYRLRVLNASNARHYELEAVTDGGEILPLVQIGADQGLLAAPVRHDRLPIAPAERYDLLVDFG